MAAGSIMQRSFDDLGRALHDVTFCVLDFETTGGNRQRDLITEVGAVKVCGGEVLGTFQTLVNPGRAIPALVSMLTGLSDALVSTAPRIEGVLASLLDFLGDAVIVGHNVSFDIGFLRAACERAAGLGVLGLDDLLALSKLGGHPQAAKLKMTADLPRTPGVYLFRGQGDTVLYVGKATNLRQRVRSYFGSDDRRKIGPMLRETQSVSHLALPDPLTAEIVEHRLIRNLLPRYNKVGTRVAKYCYVKLDVDSVWPRLTVVKRPSRTGLHLGPLPSRTVAADIVDALHTALPLRRCSAAQLGVALCPCAGTADPTEYAAAVDLAARALVGDAAPVVDRLRHRMVELAAAQRFEEAAAMRDRISAVVDAAKRRLLVDALRNAEQAEITLHDTTWIIDRGRLLDTTKASTIGRALPVAPPEVCTTDVLSPEAIDEALCIARFCESRAGRLRVDCTGTWAFPVTDRIPTVAG